MSAINILDSSVFNRIAAGEVVERPCSIVKELLENSIDAGAKTINVDIKTGGIGFIKVTDNGYGIVKDDLEKAFLPHATSKIKDITDLDNICTMGFRGEALASIASVAKVTLVSKTAQQDVASFIVLENGKIIDKGEVGAALGTSITVENLFKNIPARAKFLSKSNIEEAMISDMISKLIIANYSKSIKYSADGKTVFHSNGDTLQNAIYSVYNSEFIKNLIPIRSVMPGITLEGFINKPYYTKPNRSFQTLIINGRYVINTDISYALYDCYQNFLMKRQFPIYVLHLNLPSDMIDVNVHPNKMEVKFADFPSIRRMITSTVRDTLNGVVTLPKDMREPEDSKSSNHIIKTDLNDPVAIKENKSNETSAAKDSIAAFIPSQKDSFRIKTSMPSAIENVSYPDFENTKTLTENIKLKQPSHFSFDLETLKTDKKENEEQSGQKEFLQDDMGFTGDNFKYIGTLFDTYIILENGSSAYFIDQHAAHERILYDKLCLQFESKSIPMQNMMLPHVFDVSYAENELLKSKLDEINQCGFNINKMSGLSYAITAVPLICTEMNVEKFTFEILKNLHYHKFQKTDFVKDVLMQTACKAAVKGDEKLTQAEIDNILRDISSDKKILMCPHGRPVVIKISKNEIEKWFKRIV